MGIFNDTFTDAPATNLTAHTSDSGHSWTIHPVFSSGATVDSTTLRNTTNNVTSWAYSSWVPSSANYDVYTVLDTKNLAQQSYVGCVGRMNIADDYGIELLWQSDNDRWDLREVINGTATVKASFAQVDPDGVIAKLQMRGTIVKMFISGVEQGSFVTTVTAVGRAGSVLFMGGGSTPTSLTHVHVDSIQAADVGGSVLTPEFDPTGVLG